MIGQLEAQTTRDFLLPLFDQWVAELLDPTTFHAEHMIVMVASVELENGISALEMMAFDKTCGLELRQHAVDGRETDFFPFAQQKLVYFLGGQVPIGALPSFQHLEYFDPRQRDLQPGIANVLGFHFGPFRNIDRVGFSIS